MNMHQVMIKISIISLILLNIVPLLSSGPLESLYIVPHELIILIAASGHAKNELRTVNRYYNKYITKNNVKFISHPSFTMHIKDVDSMIMSAAWFDDVEKLEVLRMHVEKEAALRKYYDVEQIRFVPTYKANSNKPNDSYSIPIDQIKLFRNKYNNNNINQTLWGHEYSRELEPALYCAVECDDLEAINTIGSKFKRQIDDLIDSAKWRLYREEVRNKRNIALLMSIIQRDKMETFKLVVYIDPFLVEPHQDGFIDALAKAEYISQDLKDKYCQVYQVYQAHQVYKEYSEKADQLCFIFMCFFYWFVWYN